MYFNDYGAYLYLNQNRLYHFIYIKTTLHTAKKVFTTQDISLIKSFICVFYDDEGNNYLGHLNKDEIQELIKHCNMINILENYNNNNILLNYFNLSENDFNQFIYFSEEIIQYFLLKL